MTATPDSERSPRIESFGWGRIEVEHLDAPLKDAKLFPGGARGWDWNETATSHSPGIQPADVEELLEHGVTDVVLGRGVLGRLQVSDETLALLDERGIRVHVHWTKEAVRVYNQLCERARVGGLIHSTC
jgi:hypothetical protein